MDDFRRELDLKDRDTTKDGLFTVKSTRCLGACGLAPVITVNGEVHGRVGRKDVPKLIRQYRKLDKAGEVAIDRQPERPARDQEQVPAGP
jgi:(2Fe-2S) ferredoxin